MKIGVQFTGTINAKKNKRWFTFNWPANKQVVWTVVPTSPESGAPQIEWDVQVERASSSKVTYWVKVKNLRSKKVNIEARYVILN